MLVNLASKLEPPILVVPLAEKSDAKAVADCLLGGIGDLKPPIANMT